MNRVGARPTLVQQPVDWQAAAACRDRDPELWFPFHADGPQVRYAIKICAGCPVRDECRDYGAGQEHGIWGGLTEDDRRILRRRQARAELVDAVRAANRRDSA